MTTPQDPYGQQGGHPHQGGGHPQHGGPQGYPQQGGPQGYQQQPGYPPSAPPLSDSELARPARPKSVDTAFMLWMVAAGIGIVSSILNFFTVQALYDELLKDTSPELRGSVAEPGYGSAIFSLVLFALWVLVVFQMRNGANWARIVLAVLGGIGVIGGLVGLLTIGVLFSIGILGALQALLSLASLVVTIGALIFMFKSDANYYFKKS